MRLIVICGPTASGKTALATQIARETGLPIISVDSRQVYRGLDIGTGKDLTLYQFPTPVPYHLIDVVDPSRIYTVYHFQQEVYRLFESIPPDSKGPSFILCGGSGLYLEAVLRKYAIAHVPEDKAYRLHASQQSKAELELELRALSEKQFQRCDLSSKKRVIRSLEIARAEKEGVVRYSQVPPYTIEAHCFFLTTPRKTLYKKIESRLAERLASGMIQEVEGLIHSGISRDRMMLLGLEYAQITAHLNGVKDFATMEADLRLGIQHFSKRQETYFRGMARRGTPMVQVSLPGAREKIHQAVTAFGG